MMKGDYSQIKTAAISGSRLTFLGLDLVCLYEFDPCRRIFDPYINEVYPIFKRAYV